MGRTPIEWCDESWPVVAGCNRESPGCGTHEGGCYAERMAWRLANNPLTPQYHGTVRMTAHGPRWTGLVRPIEDTLLDPLHWRKHRRVFIASMSDIFHEKVPDAHLDAIFATVLACQYLENMTAHTFMALTKRANRMRDYFSAPPAALLRRWAEAADGRIILDNADVYFSEAIEGACTRSWTLGEKGAPQRVPWDKPEALFPLRNLMLGVSVEDRERLPRLDALRTTPAHRRFFSAEPLLEDLGAVDLTGIHLAIMGGESGPKSRANDLDWMRNLLGQCRAQDTAPFVKQAGANRVLGGHRVDAALAQIKSKKGNALAELPEDLRVREWCAP